MVKKSPPPFEGTLDFLTHAWAYYWEVTIVVEK